MARTSVTNTVLILDDEVYNLRWMIEFFEDKGLNVRTFSDANSIVKEIQREIFRCLVLDLNVPVKPPLDKDAKERGDIFRRYPGLFIASLARNSGYRGKQVVIYSVHKEEAVEVEAKKISCTYIRKGRPREMKEELQDILSYDPTRADPVSC